MKNRTILSLSSLAVMLTVVFAMACNKKFDEPATVTDPGVTANKTIKELKTQYPTVSGEMKLITEDIIIRGVVVGNDRTGNIYKTMFIQDATAGIQIDIDATGLYNIMPVGREVFVLCKGLYIANNANMIKLASRVIENGSPVAAGIRQIYVDSYIKRGKLNQQIDTVIVSSISQLNNDHQAMLIKLSNFEVAAGDLTKTYADTSVNKANTNISLQNCSGQSIIMRSSGYANFAAVPLPQGNGTVTAIYTVFNTTKQLVIRDTADLQLKGPRCGSGVSPTLVYKTIAEIRALGAGATIPANTGIRGTIVSNTANEANGNYRIQDGSAAGIQLRFPSFNPAFVLNDTVKIDVSGLTVDLFNGDFQINNVVNSEKIGTATVVPRVATVAQVLANYANWTSTVVTINNVTITQSTSSGTGINYNITDATGTIVTFIRTTMGYTPPASATSITGYVSRFNTTPQITLRVPADVVGGSGGPGGGTTLLDQNFEGVTTNADIAITGWQNIGETGNVKWQGKIFSSNKFAQVSAFSSAQPVVTSWLITPAMNLNATTNEVLTFKTIDGFNNGATLKVYYSTNYSGSGNPSAATWTELTATIASGTTTGYATTWTNSGNVSLGSVNGTAVYIGFKYEGADPASGTKKTTTYQVDDVKVVGQ